LGVKGLGGVLSILVRTASRELSRGFVMNDPISPKLPNKTLNDLLRIMRDHNDREYFEALGRFIHEFSQVEQILYMLLCAKLKMEMKVAAALFSGLQTAGIISNIKRLYEADGEKPPALMSTIFEHIGTLTTARNEIVHYGGEGSGAEERRVSTAIKSHMQKKAKDWPVSATTLGLMQSDAEKAYVLFLNLLSQSGAMDNHPALTRAWLYKYPSNPRGQSKKAGKKDRGKR
jgi:hypothetical protein